MVLGLTVTLTAAIIFALWASSLSKRTAVAVAGRDIPTGTTIEIDDLRAVEVAGGQGARFVPMSDLKSVVGYTVQATIPKGAILHPGLLSTRSPIEPDMAIVGVVLQPGEYPIAHLSPGQPVGVIFTRESPEPDITGESHRGTPSTITRSTRATVAEVNEMLESGRKILFLSLLVSAVDAESIGKAASAKELRLILLPEEHQSPGNEPNQQPTMIKAVQ
ncbi:SAF domain-containing protein [Candidatus Poriferisocius sp.]|uniref:SAF domain-containing protein n=1 Tax=Candidatus Poriferisocius sp. TaxID=3101276 RepID=UPI003B018FC7